jgi:hypothetical protein
MQMPPLENERHERYARGRAEGLGRTAAYGAAGYAPDRSLASKLGRRPEVVARIAELRERDPDLAGPGATIARLLRLAERCGALATAAGLKEARLAAMEACRLQMNLTGRDAWAAQDADPLPPELTEEEWVAKYGSAPAP